MRQVCYCYQNRQKYRNRDPGKWIPPGGLPPWDKKMAAHRAAIEQQNTRCLFHDDLLNIIDLV